MNVPYNFPLSKTFSSMNAHCNLFFYVALFIVETTFCGCFACLKYPEYFSFGDIYSNEIMLNTLKNPVNQQNVWDDSALHIQRYWQIMSDVTIWTLVGFGFLLSYLRFHRWMSLSLTFFFICVTVQAYALFSIFFFC